MKVKCAFGDFAATSTSRMGQTIMYTTPSGSSQNASHFLINRKCHVMGVYMFNTSSNEKDVRLYDSNPVEAAKIVANNDWDGSTPGETLYAAVQTTPLIYQTIVPMDTSLNQTWEQVLDDEDWGALNGLTLFSVSVGMDLYDTPSGIYEECPKPGYLFENGVVVNMASAMTNHPTPTTSTYYCIFYVES